MSMCPDDAPAPERRLCCTCGQVATFPHMPGVGPYCSACGTDGPSQPVDGELAKVTPDVSFSTQEPAPEVPLCDHSDRTGGNDYLLCNVCGVSWDYRREPTPAPRPKPEGAPAASRVDQPSWMDLQIALAETRELLDSKTRELQCKSEEADRVAEELECAKREADEAVMLAECPGVSSLKELAQELAHRAQCILDLEAAWRAAGDQAADYIRKHAEERTARKQAEAALAEARRLIQQTEEPTT